MHLRMYVNPAQMSFSRSVVGKLLSILSLAHSIHAPNRARLRMAAIFLPLVFKMMYEPFGSVTPIVLILGVSTQDVTDPLQTEPAPRSQEKLKVSPFIQSCDYVVYK